MKNTGILRIQAFGARQSSPIEGVLVLSLIHISEPTRR